MRSIRSKLLQNVRPPNRSKAAATHRKVSVCQLRSCGARSHLMSLGSITPPSTKSGRNVS